MQKKEVKAVLFDLDGTLVDSFEAWFEVYNSALVQFGQKALSRKQFQKRFGFPVEQDIKDYFHGATVKSIVSLFDTKFKDSLKKLALFNETIPILEFIKKKNIKMGIISNSSRQIVHATLKHFKIRKYFSIIITLEDVKRRKPAPDMLFKACRMLNMEPSEILFVGDTHNDMIAGKSAGCTTIGYKLKGDYEIKNLNEVEKFIENRVLVLDYDGVIVDSADEGLFTSLNTYSEFLPVSSFGGKKLIFSDFKNRIKKYKDDYKKFRQYRTYLRTVYDMFYIIHAIENKIDINSADDFYSFAKMHKVPQMFVDRFYKNRAKYMQSFNTWIRLYGLYPGVREFLNKKHKEEVFISTSNRAQVVSHAASYYGIKLKESNIMDNIQSHDKNDHMTIIKERMKIEYKDIDFVDDQVENLIKAKKLGVRCYIASWGYNDKSHIKKAKENGIGALSIKDFTLRF